MDRFLNHRILTLLALGSFFTFSGCAFLMRGSTQDVTITTEPPAATCYLDNFRIKTPGKFTLARKQEHEVLCEAEGYETIRGAFKRQSEAIFTVGDILTGIIPGLLVDGATGADNRLDPPELHLVLKKGEEKH